MYKYQLFCSSKYSSGDFWGYWFRIYGYGLSISNCDLTFSQRNGFKPVLIIGKIKIELLKRDPPEY